MEEEIKLIEQYRNNNEEAQKLLLNKYKDLIWYNIHQEMKYYKVDSSYLEDLFQEGCIALDNAVNSYKPEMNVSFFSLAGICIKRRLITYIKRTRIKSDYWQIVSLDMNVSEDVNLHEYIADNKNKDKKRIDQNLIERLSSFERQVLDLRNEGYSYNEIATQLSVNSKKIDNTISSIKRKIKNMSNEDAKNGKMKNSDTLRQIEESVVKLREKNYTYKQIALKLDISVKEVNNAMSRIRHKNLARNNDE